MKIAVVGSSGYIAQFLIKRLETLDSITKVKKFDREGSDLSYKLELTQAEQFDYSQLDDVNYIVFTAVFLDQTSAQTILTKNVKIEMFKPKN